MEFAGGQVRHGAVQAGVGAGQVGDHIALHGPLHGRGHGNLGVHGLGGLQAGHLGREVQVHPGVVHGVDGGDGLLEHPGRQAPLQHPVLQILKGQVAEVVLPGEDQLVVHGAAPGSGFRRSVGTYHDGGSPVSGGGGQRVGGLLPGGGVRRRFRFPGGSGLPAGRRFLPGGLRRSRLGLLVRLGQGGYGAQRQRQSQRQQQRDPLFPHMVLLQYVWFPRAAAGASSFPWGRPCCTPSTRGNVKGKFKGSPESSGCRT